MLIRVLFSSLILILTGESFSSNHLFVSLENSTSHLQHGRALSPARFQGKFFEICNIHIYCKILIIFSNIILSIESLFFKGQEAWDTFQHTGNNRFISPPEIFISWVRNWDSGVIGKRCECEGDECPTKCNKVGCPDGKCDPAPHMICDLRGNWIQWSQLRNGSVVKIRTMYRHWPGYEYLYTSVKGRYLVVIIKNITSNHMENHIHKTTINETK